MSLLAVATSILLPGDSLSQAATAITQAFTYQSTITTDANGPLDLKAAVAYPDTLAAGSNAPIAIVMHGYSPSTGNISEYLSVASRQAQKGIVSIVVAMRGRDGSDGIRDSGGLEIYDIYDAIEHIKADPFFADKINPNNLYLSGYSGGGGNTMSALTKFPDYFNLGAAFFGMSDYGYDRSTGWYYNGANVGGTRTPILNADIGYRATTDATALPAILDKYLARDSNLASKNNPYSEIHLFVNADEPICPIINDTLYVDHAAAAASFPGEFDNIHLHTGQSNDSSWVDWNGNSIKESIEVQNWPHGLSQSIQDRGEAWYLDRVLSNSVPHPTLNDSDELFVAGYVRTKPFQLFVGNGQNAAANLSYSLSGSTMQFGMSLASSDKSATAVLTLYENRLSTARAAIELNGQIVAEADISYGYVFQGLRDGDTLRFLAIPEPATTCLLTCGAAVACCSRHFGKLLRCRNAAR